MQLSKNQKYICKVIVFIIIVIIVLFFSYKYNTNSDTNNSTKIEKFENSDNNNSVDNDKSTPKIAFLFLTYNNLKRPDIWNKFFGIDDNNNNSNKSKYSNKYTIYNHAKESDKVTDILLKDRHIPEHIETCWGCFGTVEANILMMKEALKDPLNKKFILVSDSCIPILSFDKFYNEVMKDDKSRINIHNFNDLINRYDNIVDPDFLKDEFTIHNAQGLTFNRYHSTLLVNSLLKYKNKWINVLNVDEHYFGNTLRILDSKFNYTICIDKPAFDIWAKNILDNSKIDYNIDIISDSYINIKKLSNKAVDEIRDKKFLLVRKIDKDTDIDYKYILQN